MFSRHRLIFARTSISCECSGLHAITTGNLPVSAEDNQVVCDLIIAACENALDSYADDSAEISSAEDGSVSSRRRKLAQIVLSGEKRCPERY